MGLHLEELITGGLFVNEISGGFILREGLFSGGALTIGILRYNHTKNTSAGER